MYIPWIMSTGTFTLIMGYEFKSCGILQLKMQGWVGRVTLCTGEFFMPTLCTLYPPSYVLSIHTLTHGGEFFVKDMPGYAIPSFVCQMRWDNKWCNAMWKSIYDFIGDHPCPPTRRKQSLPELSIVMLFRLHFSSLLVLFKFEMVYVVLPPCVGCESLCDDVWTIYICGVCASYIYVCCDGCLYMYLLCIYVMWCTVGTRSFIR